MKLLKVGLFFCLMLISLNNPVQAQEIYAKTATTPVGGADGVAVWVNAAEPSKSLIIGAIPNIGLATYELDGSLREVFNFGTKGAGEVDVRYNFPLNGKKIPIIVSANKEKNVLRIFTIDPQERLLKEITGNSAKLKIEAYGSCMYHSKKSDKYYEFITSHEGLLEQWELFDNGKGKVDAKLVREINIMPQVIENESPTVEACVADDYYGYVYFSQENECKIWRYNAEPDGGNKRILMDNAKIKDGDNVEGLAIYPIDEKKGYLLASIQGSWKYKIYDRETPNKLLASFQLFKADSSEVIEAHDCIEIVNLPLGDSFPMGVMVTQSANNSCGRHYQIIPWQLIAKQFNLKMNPKFDAYGILKQNKK